VRAVTPPDGKLGIPHPSPEQGGRSARTREQLQPTDTLRPVGLSSRGGITSDDIKINDFHPIRCRPTQNSAV